MLQTVFGLHSQATRRIIAIKRLWFGQILDNVVELCVRRYVLLKIVLETWSHNCLTANNTYHWQKYYED